MLMHAAVYRRVLRIHKSGQPTPCPLLESTSLEVLVTVDLTATVKRETGILTDNLYCPRNGK